MTEMGALNDEMKESRHLAILTLNMHPNGKQIWDIINGFVLLTKETNKPVAYENPILQLFFVDSLIFYSQSNKQRSKDIFNEGAKIAF
jgi:hypothetical protein